MSLVHLNVGTLRLVVEAFRWSLALIAKIVVRSIIEGSTLATWYAERPQGFSDFRWPGR